jgi:hypothetical protein
MDKTMPLYAVKEANLSNFTMSKKDVQTFSRTKMPLESTRIDDKRIYPKIKIMEALEKVSSARPPISPFSA